MENLKVINSSNLLFNLEKFSDKKICAMVKSNAYGHGLFEIVKILDGKVDYFGVANVVEAQKVRRISNSNILIFGKLTSPKICKRLNADVVIEDEKDLVQCLKYGLQNIHLKIDCGMNRFGAKNQIELSMIEKLLIEKNIELKSILTHFPKTKSKNFTLKCLKRFFYLKNFITQTPPISFGGTGISDFQENFDILRVGIGLYGYGNSDLKPVMTIKSYVEKIVTLKKGEMLGYGHILKKSGIFAILPMGYGDGIRQKAKIKVKIGDKTFKNEGKLCMDAMFIRVDENVKVGDEVIIMDDAENFEKGVSAYEVLTNFSKMRGKTIII